MQVVILKELACLLARRGMLLYVPVPASGSCWGLPPPLSLTETSANRAPVAVGVNVTAMEQLAPAATLPGQLLTWAKSPGFVPVIVIPKILSVTVPLLVS